jgi:L-malate glycosyltransferase
VSTRWPAGARICIAGRAPFLGGAEIAAERLAFGLRDAGYSVTMLFATNGECLQRAQAAGVRCLHTPFVLPSIRHYWAYRSARAKLTTALQNEQPALIHSNDLPTHRAISDAARGLGVPMICHHRGVFDGSAMDWFLKFPASRHLFVSDALCEELCARSRRLRACPKSVVYDGVPIPQARTASSRAAARARIGVPIDSVVVTFAGRLVPVKGVDTLLQAWAQVRNRIGESAELLLVGGDAGGPGNARKLADLDAELNTRARFVGHQVDVNPWLHAADVAVVPSLLEPLGLVAIEASAEGLPVVASRVGGLSEIVVDGVTGVLVPPGDPNALSAALIRLLEDPDLRRRLGDQARRRCQERFSIAAHVRAILDQYDQVL